MKSFVGIDLGASGTRHVSNECKVNTLPNNMVFLDKDARVDLEPYSEDIESALDVAIEKEGESQYFPARVLIGNLATRYMPTNQRPSVMANKHVQQINYISAITAVAVNKIRFGLGENISMYLAMPPIEVKNAKDELKNNFLGKYKVTFSKLDKVIEFTIDDVVCYEESFMALLSYFFELNGSLKDESANFRSGNILSMDIGASTTDLAVVSDMRYIEKSGQTYKTGGNVARDFLMDDLRAEYGFDVPVEIADTAMAEGRIQMGNTFVDIAPMVRTAKERFAEQIVEQIQGYFRKVGIPIQSIRAIVVSGGGSMPGSYVNDKNEVVVTSEAMSFFITRELNKICPGVEVVPYEYNPRMANIYGLYIRASIDMARKYKA